MTIHTKTPSADDEFFTTKDAAHLLQLSHRTLERMRVEGGGPPFIKAGNGKRARVLYLKSDLISWLKARRFDNTSQYSNP
ncbi:MAG: hypothetical protein DHS20C08_23840 [Rhodomicrobium sp.]|nr:MAG: hypothetical protein DHS20C08_23840 [Rhodomicrobium sp.]